MTKNKMFMSMVMNYLIRKKSRVVIAMLAIAIGATILFGLLTIYYDIPRQLGKEFRSYGANLVILPGGDEAINLEEFNEMKGQIGEKKLVGMAPYRYWTCKINEQPYMLAGTDLEQAKGNSPFWYIEGRWVENGEHDKVMVGKEIAKKLDLRIGDSITVQGVKYGKTAKSSSQDASAEENKEKDLGADNFSKKLFVEGIVSTGGAEEGFIFLEMNSLSEIIEGEFEADIIECSIEASGQELDDFAGKINEKNAKVMARPVRRVTQSQDQVLEKLNSLVLLVTVVILIITMISVSTTMMAMVAERKTEIALKKALGAENKRIINEFMVESIILAILGGILGIILGYFFAKHVSLSVFGRSVDFQLMLAPLALVASVIVTCLASIWPVRKVLEIEAAVVLKGE